MKEKLIKLLEVKSIITIVLLGIFAYGFVIGKIDGEQVVTATFMILTYFFNKDSKKVE